MNTGSLAIGIVIFLVAGFFAIIAIKKGINLGQEKDQYGTNGTYYKVIGVIFAVMAVGSLIYFSHSAVTLGPPSGGSDAKVCGSCDREYTSGSNYKCIKYTGMCKNCYENFCFMTGREPENYD